MQYGVFPKKWIGIGVFLGCLMLQTVAGAETPFQWTDPMTAYFLRAFESDSGLLPKWPEQDARFLQYGTCGMFSDLAVAETPIDGNENLVFGNAYISGRLYRIDANTGEVTLLNSDLHMPHGLTLYQNEAKDIHLAYLTEIYRGNIVSVDLRTGVKEKVCNGIYLPARLAIVGELEDGRISGYVTELLSGRLLKVTWSGHDPADCQKEVVANRLVDPDGITLESGRESALIASFAPAEGLVQIRRKVGKISRIALDGSGRVLQTIGEGVLKFPIISLRDPFDEAQNAIYVTEFTGNRIAHIVYSNDAWKITHYLGDILGPTGLQWSSDKKSLFVAEALKSRILRIDPATGEREIVAILNCL